MSSVNGIIEAPVGGNLWGFFVLAHKGHSQSLPRHLMNVQYPNVAPVVPNMTCLDLDLPVFLLTDPYHFSRLLGTSQITCIGRGLLSSVCALESG
jgi:hypothetical protein